MSEIPTAVLLISIVALSITGSAVFCLFERIIAVLRPVLVVCSNDAECFADPAPCRSASRSGS